jgi:hypothetical protein
VRRRIRGFIGSHDEYDDSPLWDVRMSFMRRRDGRIMLHIVECRPLISYLEVRSFEKQSHGLRDSYPLNGGRFLFN